MAGARRIKVMPSQASWAGAQLPRKASDVKVTEPHDETTAPPCAGALCVRTKAGRRRLACATRQLKISDELATCCHRPARQRDRLHVARFLLRTLEFAFCHLLICLVDRLSRLPRDSCRPDGMRLYRENLTASQKGPSNRCAGSSSTTFASPRSSSFNGTWMSIARVGAAPVVIRV